MTVVTEPSGRLRLPLIALTVGDPAGIGPEIALAAAKDPLVRRAARLLILGPGILRPSWIPGATDPDAMAVGEEADETWLDTGGPASWEMGRVQAECGRAALSALRRGAELAGRGSVNALVTCPVSKEALHAAGERVEGQTELLGRWAGASRFQMVAVAGKLRAMLLTRHMPLKQAIEWITEDRVLDHLRLFDEALQQWGVRRPRLALAGLNPHAGERGILGREEVEVLGPAAQRARDEDLDVHGPLPPDSVFAQAARGAYDGVLALYHDQAFIPVKLLGNDAGMTVLAGFPYLRVSPIHGTAFDIAGQGKASPKNLKACLLQAAAWACGAPVAG